MKAAAFNPFLWLWRTRPITDLESAHSAQWATVGLAEHLGIPIHQRPELTAFQEGVNFYPDNDPASAGVYVQFGRVRIGWRWSIKLGQLLAQECSW